jgi:hypothetical protein
MQIANTIQVHETPGSSTSILLVLMAGRLRKLLMTGDYGNACCSGAEGSNRWGFLLVLTFVGMPDP